MRAVIAGGGTAGHVNPALALAGALGGDEVTFIGTTRGAEAMLVPAAGHDLVTIDVRGFDRSRPASIVATGIVAARAVRTARRTLRRLAPDVVVGMGGYVSLPVCLAARASAIPIVLHEQNIVFGLANRVCKPFARRVAVSFAESLRSAGPRGVFVGNPVAAELTEARDADRKEHGIARFGLERGRKTLLVFGGSQGAQRINDAAAQIASRWRSRGDRQLVHIAGRSGPAPAPVVDVAGEEGLIYRVVEFVDRMVDAYAVADLALCRGGATTVAELGAVGLPAIIVPYPYHRDRQQQLHGEVLERAGAAVVIGDGEVTGERVALEVERLFSQEGALTRMSRAATSLGTPDAAQRLALVVRETAA
ncbi:undecaprenyldiphospho-muramoylpentapeptide beta-N-acetylglucosaminyltransferase [soil metagenome]